MYSSRRLLHSLPHLKMATHYNSHSGLLCATSLKQDFGTERGKTREVGRQHTPGKSWTNSVLTQEITLMLENGQSVQRGMFEDVKFSFEV